MSSHIRRYYSLYWVFLCSLKFTDDPCPPGREFKECVCPEYIHLNSSCIEEEWDKGGEDKCELDPVEGCFCPPHTKEEDGSCVPCCRLSNNFHQECCSFE